MARYCFDTDPMADFRKLCECMKGKPLQSPYRSTVPLLSLVEHSRPNWRELLTNLGAPPDSTTYFEYCVPSPKANGNPSQTDALIMSKSKVWGIEAKWTESRYETVERRIRKPEADGADPRKTVEGWLGYLQPYASRPLLIDDFADAVYQTVHRAASACAVATAKQLRPELVYLHFHPSPSRKTATTAQYVSDLRHLRALLGVESGLGITVVEMSLEPTAAFREIQDLDRHQRVSADTVLAALCHGPLFEFRAPEVTVIG
jgi:hypothetical protein